MILNSFIIIRYLGHDFIFDKNFCYRVGKWSFISVICNDELTYHVFGNLQRSVFLRRAYILSAPPWMNHGEHHSSILLAYHKFVSMLLEETHSVLISNSISFIELPLFFKLLQNNANLSLHHDSCPFILNNQNSCPFILNNQRCRWTRHAPCSCLAGYCFSAGLYLLVVCASMVFVIHMPSICVFSVI